MFSENSLDLTQINVSFTQTGVSSPSSGQIKLALQEWFYAIFGTDANLDDATALGQLITGLTKIIADKNAQMTFIVNQFNPTLAEEPFQDALGQLYFLNRKGATSSTVMCLCIGAEGTVLNGLSSSSPARAVSSAGDIFVCVDGGTIPSDGQIMLAFQAEKKGPVPVGANTVNSIYTQVYGWDSVNNPSSGVIGVATENQYDYEQRRINSLAINSTGNIKSVYARVFDVDGVTDCIALENDSDNPVTAQGVLIKAHSVYVCVNGGESADIAEAIFNSKSGGCDTTGSVSVQLPEALLPINFDRASNVETYVSVILAGTIDETVITDVQNAVVNNFNGTDEQGNHVTLGQTVYASRFYCVLNQLGYQVVDIQIGLSSDSLGNSVSFNANQMPVLTAQNVSVTGETA